MRRAAAVLVAAVSAAAPQVAAAATRYVAPSGIDSGACPRAAPCSIAFGINGAGSREGDTIILLSGTYTDQPVVLDKGLTIAGPEAGPRPVLRATADGGAVVTIGAGSSGTVITHVAVRAGGDGTTGFDVQDTAALDDLDVRTTTGPCLASSATGVRVDDSMFTETGVATDPCLQATGDDTEWNGVTVTGLNVATAASMSGNGKIFDSDFTGQVTGLELRGQPDAHRVTAIGAQRGITMSGAVFVTDSVAISRAAGGSAVYAADGNHQLLNLTAWGEGEGSYGIRALDGAVIQVKNTIARGAAADLSADPATTTITADCEAFTGCPAGSIAVEHSNFVTAPGVQDLGANSSKDPKFADAAFEDFHLRRDSPAVDAGSFEFNSGSADRDGRFRWLGKAPDVGAYEYAPPHRTRKADTVAPRLKRVFLDPARFRVTRAGSAFSAQAVPSGTTLHFRITEASDLVLTVSRPGRNKPIIGTLVRPFRIGSHRMSISGELDHHFLAPGRYVLTVIARDVAQNLSREQRLPFVVVR